MKNIITNFLGLILWVIAVYQLIIEPITVGLITSVSLLIVIGGVLFLFSNKALKDLLSSIVDSKRNILKKELRNDTKDK